MKLKVYIGNKEQFLKGDYFRGLVLVDDWMTDHYESNGFTYLHDVDVDVESVDRVALGATREMELQVEVAELKSKYEEALLGLHMGMEAEV